MDSLTDGTASLLQYDDRRRQLDLLCVIGMHSSVRYAATRTCFFFVRLCYCTAACIAITFHFFTFYFF